MELGGALFGAMAAVIALVLVGVYVIARSRHGKAPAHAEEAAHTGPDPAGDEDPIPRESGGGMPMVSPGEDGARSVEDMQRRAEGDTP